MKKNRPAFRVQTVYKVRKYGARHYARQKLTFMVTVFSMFAFVVGNMVGQHGWYTFWKSVLGKEDVEFAGTVPPIAMLPDYQLWSQYGGNKKLHTFNQAPQSVLKSLPEYDPTSLAQGGASFAHQVYSTLWKGGYATTNGSHTGIDIDAPRGTPVVSIANGIVTKVSMQENGFGHYVLISHPNVPDPKKPGATMSIYSSYAHLDDISVREGDSVQKGQAIGTVGNSGFTIGSTGYHLLFSVERADAPYHPYWAFTSGDAQNARMSFVQAVNSTLFQDRIEQYTLSPMLYVQQYLNYRPSTTVVASATTTPPHTAAPHLSPAERRAQARQSRMTERLARSRMETATTVAASPQVVLEQPVVVAASKTEEILPIIRGTNQDVDHISIEHDGRFTRAVEKVTIRAYDNKGEVVKSPAFSGRLYLVATFGEAEFRPAQLSSLDFVNGVATVNVVARSGKTLVFEVKSPSDSKLTMVSAPMTYER